MASLRLFSRSLFFVSTLTLFACGGGGGNSTTNQSVPQVTNTNETPTASSNPVVTYTTSIEQNLSTFNEKNTGTTVQLSPTNLTTKSVINPSYSVKSYDASKLSFYYTFDTNKVVIVNYDRLSDKVINARIDTADSTLSCYSNKLSPTACDGIRVIYDDRTGDSTILFNKQQFENSYYQKSATAPFGSEEVKYQVAVNGTVKGNITSKPLVFSDFDKTHTGNIIVNGKQLDIFRAFMRDSQLVIQFTNGESLYLLTGKSSGLISEYYGTDGDFSTSTMASLKTLANDRVNIKLNDIYFSSEAGTKIVSGEITLVGSYAKIDIPNVGKIDTKRVYAYELSNKELTYFITSTSGSGQIFVQGQNPIKIDINGYSCTLNECNNVEISKDGTYIKLNGTLLNGIKVTGTIRTNIH
ncbi:MULTISPECIES: hypothetical protein [Acinetobacter]|uniref:hypothetical protein n=1 Tax=Acinetobacter TaxID=469 RepID=UPI000D00A67E|nr:hypothetical protein [Acinetobacter sp. MYb10]QLD63112.1 hypothetical protein CQZ96_018385 [Acinetobacter sp. MYb10]